MRKQLFLLLLAGLMLLMGCQAGDSANITTLSPTDPTPDPDVVEVVEIIDIAQRDGLSCDTALEPFFEDGEYIYSYPCIKSEYVIVRYSDGTEETAENALKTGRIAIADLDIYGISYYTQPLTPEVTPAETEYLLAAPVLPEMAPFPTDQSDWDAWEQQQRLWQESRYALHSAPEGYAHGIEGFWKESTAVYLSGKGNENAVYSPVSLYMALAMLAQTTGGQSQQEILDLLGAQSMDALATQAGYLYLNHYENDGVHTNILANSIWLDEGRAFHPETVTLLADKFFASVYQGALESPELNDALKNWLNEQTGGLLQESIMGLTPMDVNTVFAIASTIHYRCCWQEEFNPAASKQDIFYSPVGEQTVTYLKKTHTGGYYQSQDYAATYISLDDGSRMWLILPEENTTPEKVTAAAMDMILSGKETDKTYSIELAVPKFDISADLNLLEGLHTLGVRQVQDWNTADFSPISSSPDIYLGSARQGVRVSIDEEGLTGVAYTVMMMPGKGAFFGDAVELVLNRPFLFVVESPDGVPLFTGIVNQP